MELAQTLCAALAANAIDVVEAVGLEGNELSVAELDQSFVEAMGSVDSRVEAMQSGAAELAQARQVRTVVDELLKEPARRVRKCVRHWKRFYDCLLLVNSWERFDAAQAAVEAGQSLSFGGELLAVCHEGAHT